MARVNEANELMELMNCIRQFETDIKSEKDENWRQYRIISEQKTKKLAKVKQKLQCALQNSELEVSRMREKVRKAKKDFNYCDKQVAEYTAAVEAARYEQDEMERESKDLDEILAGAEKSVIESILKVKIQIYEQAKEEKKKIDAKLGLLDGIDSEPYQEDISAVQIPNDI
ncbi:hypothetical protein X798_05170 [Onchocerca flexuosa]|uniref:Uncharacterized protein n=1 Tax=Onchocerca flexuosa TaxID=387005 RepID=A0A238BR40_9BILA|nr:hypothetical protein X798_05170 [Onchocerca flexuosa]